MGTQDNPDLYIHWLEKRAEWRDKPDKSVYFLPEEQTKLRHQLPRTPQAAMWLDTLTVLPSRWKKPQCVSVSLKRPKTKEMKVKPTSSQIRLIISDTHINLWYTQLTEVRKYLYRWSNLSSFLHMQIWEKKNNHFFYLFRKFQLGTRVPFFKHKLQFLSVWFKLDLENCTSYWCIESTPNYCAETKRISRTTFKVQKKIQS